MAEEESEKESDESSGHVTNNQHNREGAMIICRDRREKNSRARLLWGDRGLVPSKSLALLIQPGMVLGSLSPFCTYTSHCLYQFCSTRNLDQRSNRVSHGCLGVSFTTFQGY